MGDPAGRAVLADLVEQACADGPALDAVVRAAREKSPAVAALPECEVRRNVAALLRSVARGFAGDGPGAADLAAADALASDRVAQGVALSGLLEGFQAGRAHLLLTLTAGARARGVAPETLIDGLVELDAFTTDLQNRLIHTYRTVELHLTRTGYAIRVQALRSLLHADGEANAAEAGLDSAQSYHCLIADVTDPREAPRIEAALGGITGFVDGYLCSVAARMPPKGKLTEVTVVASPARPPAQLAAVYPLCQAALESARRRGLRGLRPLTGLAALAAGDAYPRLGPLLAEELLGNLDPAKDFHRLLAETALAYLDRDRRLGPTAAYLHLHPNTVKHRLGRIAELTGFGAAEGSVTDSMRWWWALDAWLRRPPGAGRTGRTPPPRPRPSAPVSTLR
jgi:hypothetical protein